MELEALEQSGIGVGLSAEERALLEILFAQAQQDAKGQRLLLWGRLAGTTRDYLLAAARAERGGAPGYQYSYIVTGTGSTALTPVPELLEEHRHAAAAVGNGRFLGVPGKLLGPEAPEEEEQEEEAEEAPQQEADEQLDADGNPPATPPPPRAPKPPKPVPFTEAHRLAWTINAIAADTTLVPAGAFVVEPHGGGVSPNPSFTGLNPSRVGGLDTLLHFRPPTAPHRQQALARGGLYGGPSEWLDPASEDEPLPSIAWAVRKDASAADGRLRLIARSLKWPGAHFVAAIGGPAFGNVYVGDGTENKALPFMV